MKNETKINLQVKNVNKKLNNYYEIISLYLNSFPSKQLAPLWILRLWLWRKNIHFLSFYDNNQFIGFCFFIIEKDTIFILYLAINQTIRSKGYGSAILEYIAKNFDHQSIVLEIEEVNKKHQDYEIRLKRLNFYLKNNFKISEYINQYHNEKFQILFMGKKFDPQLYKKIYCKLSLGTYKPKIIYNSYAKLKLQ